MGIKAHYLQDNDGNKFYPFSHINATYDKNGQVVGDRLDKMDNNILNKAPLKHTHNSDEVNVILEFDSKDKFPLPGVQHALFIDATADEIYRWSESEFKYRRMNSIDSINVLDGKTVRIILNAKDTEEWNQNLTYIPDKGEVCIYTDLNRAKIGNGTTTIDKLGFAWLSAKDFESMTHSHHNDDILKRITAAFTTEMEESLNDLVERNPEENVQSDWTEDDDNSDAYIKNKPGKVSAFDNDKGYITNTELDQTKSELEESAAEKAALAETAAKEFASQLVRNIMGNITDETLDTIEEIAKAINDNESIMEALTDAIGSRAEKSVVDEHIKNNDVHVTHDLKEQWNQAEKNQDAYTIIAIDNKETLYSHRSRDVLNFETADGIEYVFKEGSGDINTPYDTIKIKNTRPTYTLISEQSEENSIGLILMETFPLTDKTNYYKIPIKVTGITNISKNGDLIVIDTPEVLNIRGNAETATRLQNTRTITINIGSEKASTEFDGAENAVLTIESINASDIKQNEGDEIILSSAL